jgi:putative flippase GtrA
MIMTDKKKTSANEHQLPAWAAHMNPFVRHVIMQFLGFGVVGFVSFIIDWGVLNILVDAFHMNPTVSGTISFLISLIFNYIVSMQYVFVHRADMARWMEILIFLICSVIGLIINSGIIALMTEPLLRSGAKHGTVVLMTNVAKIVATIIVSVWNFFSRKFTIDAPRTGHENDNTFAHRVGLWSLTHGMSPWNPPTHMSTSASVMVGSSFLSQARLPADPVSLPLFQLRRALGEDPAQAATHAAVQTRGISRKHSDRQQAMQQVGKLVDQFLASQPSSSQPSSNKSAK